MSVSVIEPAWVDAAKRHRQGIPGHFYHWLSDQGSLTSKVVGACDKPFSVRVIRQQWGRATYSEQRLLGRPFFEIALIREVELLCGKQPWVFARTIIPVTSLEGKARRLAHLGNRPLGALLFSDPTTARHRLQYGRLSKRHQLYRSATQSLTRKPRELWGRRTLFGYAGKPILVNEIFLPQIPAST